MNAIKTEFEYGQEYAEWIIDNEPTAGPVDIDAACGSSVDIPDGDYRAMREGGIENPNARLYWSGYNNIFNE